MRRLPAISFATIFAIMMVGANYPVTVWRSARAVASEMPGYGPTR